MTTQIENASYFMERFDEASLVFPLLAKGCEITWGDGATIETESALNASGVPVFNIPPGFDVPANDAAHHVCKHEAGHAYARMLEAANRIPLLGYLSLFRDRFGYDATVTEESWAEVFANACEGAVVTSKIYHDETVDPLEARAWFLSLVPAPAMMEAPAMPGARILWHLSHHSSTRPDGWGGAPDEARWIREDLTPRVVAACELLGMSVTLVDGDGTTTFSGDHPEFHATYDAFIAPHYEANLHDSRGWVWGRAAASLTAQKDDELGAIFQRRYQELCLKTDGPPVHFDWLNPNITDYYGFRLTDVFTPGILVEHGVGWNVPADYDYSWLRTHVQDIADVWALTLLEFTAGPVVAAGGPKVLATLPPEEDDMTPEQEAKLDRVLALLEAEGPKVWTARHQRGLDVETGQPFDASKAPADSRIAT